MRFHQERRSHPLSPYIFLKDPADNNQRKLCEKMLKQTQITQPAMYIADMAMYRLLREVGIKPDLITGHSLGEYAAAAASGVLSTMRAVSGE